MDAELSAMDFFRRGAGFDLLACFDEVAKRERERALGKLVQLGELPPRPHLDWYRSEARQRHELLAQSIPSTKLSQAQDRLAREHGFTSWPQFARAVHDRNLRAQQFGLALRDHNDRSVIETLAADPGAVVDVALNAPEDELSYLGHVGRYGPQPAVATLHLVLFALAKYGASPRLPRRLGAIVLPDFDWQAAMTVLRDRQREAELDPRRAKEVDLFDEALSALAVYDEPDFDGELSDD